MSLMYDVFANFVVQMIIEGGYEERQNYLHQAILTQVPQLSFDKFGCRII